MDNPTKTRAIELAAEHSKHIDNILAVHKVTREDLTRQLMKDPTKILPHLLKEVYYLDAYTKLVNEVNYTPVDKKDWRAVDYIEQLFTRVYEWAKDADDLLQFHLETGTAEQVPVIRRQLFESILVATLMEELAKDDEEQYPALTYDAAGGPEPGPGSS